jgi:DNA-binding PadR family transcriptional regulator
MSSVSAMARPIQPYTSSHRRWIRAQWKSSDNNRRSKFYSLTPLGPQAARKGNGELEPRVEAISGIVSLKEARNVADARKTYTLIPSQLRDKWRK